MKSETITYRRDELYDQVWKEPLHTLARTYDISDVWLSKVCRKLSVPTPGRGYWARKRAGWEEKAPPLPPLPDGQPAEITVPSRRQKAFLSRILRPAEGDEQPARQKPPVVRVSERLDRPHRLVAEASRLLRGREAHEGLVVCWNVSCLNIRVAKDSLSRAFRIMNALLSTMEERGYKVEVTQALTNQERQQHQRHDGEPDNATRVLVSGEWIEFAMMERSSIIREAEEPPKYLKGTALDSWLLTNHVITRYVPNGTLELKVTNPDFLGTRTTWADGKRQRLEQCLGAFVANLEMVAGAKRQHRLGLERQHVEYEENRRRQEGARARAAEEAEREKLFEADLRDWCLTRDVREYAAEIRRLLGARHAEAEAENKWLETLEWMETYAARKDPLSGLRAAEKEQDEQRG
jgi:hypothetical protein